MANQDTDVRGRGDDGNSWETFCREEARQWASAFLERVRSFKMRNPIARGVHDSTFTNEFSAAFLEESSVLMTSTTSNGVLPHANGESSQLTSSLLTSDSHSTISTPATSSEATPSPRKSGNSKAKSWISHLFKWSKSQRGRRSGPSSSSRQGRTRRNTDMVKEDVVRMLNMNADDSLSVCAWQQCRLALLKENTNHQLEVYCPPKNSVPKMSLFCFLIKEVRPATSLEIPDSTTCFVIKSQNHGEYVFDAGSEAKKQSWISNIKAYSTNLATPMNGHLPGYSGGNVGRRRSHSIGAGDLRNPHSSTLPRALPPPPQLTAGGGGRRGSGELNRLALPTTVENNSEESVLMDVSSFIRNSPQRSPSRRRRVQSMFVESTLTTHLDNTPTDTHPASQGAGFPYDSPCPTPPPIPKRGFRPKNISVGSSGSDHQPKCRSPRSPISPIVTSPIEGGVPQRRLSQPHVELPSNLDTCSVSSSSSALHPVTLADIERRGPLSPAHLTYSSQLSILSEGHGAAAPKPPTTRTRKISAPVVIPNQPYLDRDIVHPEPQATAIAKALSSEQSLPSPTGNHDNDQSEPITPNNDDVTTPVDRDEDMSSKATLSFPVSSRTHSPGSPLFRIPSEEDTQPDTRRRLVPYTRLNVSSLVARVNQTSPRESETRAERSHSQASSHTEGSEDREAGQPLYIETTGTESVSQPTTHTRHPYENWATTPQDVQNLRQLSQYPWFHGMISRNNASQLVLSEGDAGSGQYLVRQSESREGDFVLTFNYHNRAKHLRMTLDENGCNIQHLWFDDVPSMLEYFKANSIPLESFWLNNDVKLTTFIDRKKSDAFRTTTVVNMTQLSRVPPRRSRSLHLTMSQAVAANADTPSPIDPSISSSSSSNSQSTNSLPQSAHNGVGNWRQLFRSQRSSSAGNMNVHGVRGGAGVQRRHSTNVGSRLDTRGRGGSGHGSGRNGQNTYVYRNY